LTNNPAEDGLAVFSPDGTWIAFVSNRGGGWGAYITPSGGGPITRLPLENLQFAAGGDRHSTTERISWGP
ncbi:MAG: hypothetical protein R3264_16765, partial [Anaerolineae bacterium]|nr:hypothetical protein [Anaerolineae bacterium]